MSECGDRGGGDDGDDGGDASGDNGDAQLQVITDT